MGSADGFEEFVAVVDCGSITAAASQLGLPRPTLSRRLGRLEERLGVRLLRRTTRRMHLTQQGEVLYASARRVVEAAAEAEDAVRRLDGVPRGLLRVSVPAEMPQAYLAGWLIEFLEAWPEVRVDLLATNAQLDLVANGIDVALFAAPIDDPSLVVKTIAQDLRVAVASPEYLAAHGTPETADDLAQHNCIVGYSGRAAPQLRWPLRDGGWVPVSGTLTTNQMSLRLNAARLHLGIALVADRMAHGSLAEGALVAVLPDVVGRRARVCLAYPDREFLEPKVRLFVDFIAEKLAAARARRFVTSPS
jgi:DNA-binding transcriptional LysR family regulator